MGKDFSIVVGTVGSGLFYSRDSGRNWKQSPIKVPVAPWAVWIQIRAVAVAPYHPGLIFAGADVGLYRSDDAGATWVHVPSPADGGPQIWSIAWHPDEPDTVFVGCAPGAIHRSRDCGATWETLPVPCGQRSPVGATHITSIRFDPRDHKTIWAGVEVEGVIVSRDGGDSWVELPPIGDRLQERDVHDVLATPDGLLLVAGPDGLYKSRDEGQSFELHKFPAFPEPEPAAVAAGVQTYARGMAVKTDDPNTLFIGTGDYVPGQIGAIEVSHDGGNHWSPAQLSTTPNSTIYLFATHAADADVIVAASTYGNIFVSEDGGEHWQKTKREFGEVRGLAWLPN